MSKYNRTMEIVPSYLQNDGIPSQIQIQTIYNEQEYNIPFIEP